MNRIREKAQNLRLEGKSYNEIRKELGVAKSTLSLWLRDVVLSDAAQARLGRRAQQGILNGLVKRNKEQTDEAWKRANTIHSQAKREVSRLSKKDLFLVGVALYWAEGYKKLRVQNGKERTGHTISFVNSDPEMIRIFVRFLREILEIPKEKIRMTVRLHNYIEEEKAIKYWRDITSLPKECIRNSTLLISSASKSKRPFNRLPYGTLQIWVADTQKFHRVLGWIEGLKKQI